MSPLRRDTDEKDEFKQLFKVKEIKNLKQSGNQCLLNRL